MSVPIKSWRKYKKESDTDAQEAAKKAEQALRERLFSRGQSVDNSSVPTTTQTIDVSKDNFDSYKLTEKELNNINKLKSEINKINIYTKLVEEYSKLLDNKVERLYSNIDEEFDILIESIKNKKKELKNDLKIFHNNKSKKCENELKSLNLYNGTLIDKYQSCKSFVESTKDMDMDDDERETMILSMTISDANNSKSFMALKNIYANEFNSIAHFQKLLTRPRIIYDIDEIMETLKEDKSETKNSKDDTKNDENESDNDSDDEDDEIYLTDIIESYGIIREEGLNELIALFEEQIPEDITQKEKLKNLIKEKTKYALNVLNQAKNNLLSLKAKDLQTLYNQNTANKELIMLIECFMIIFNKVDDKTLKKWEHCTDKQRNNRWKTIKEILINPKFIGDIFTYDAKKLTDNQRKFIFDVYMTETQFKYEIVKKQNQSAAMLIHWIISLIRWSRYEHKLNDIRESLKKDVQDIANEHKKQENALEKAQTEEKSHFEE